MQFSPPQLLAKPGPDRMGKVCPQCNKNKIRYNKNNKEWKCYDCHTNFKEPNKRYIANPTGKPRQKLTGKQVPTKTELHYKINRIENQRDKALISLLYLSGCRISEIVGDPNRDPPIPCMRKFQLELKETTNKQPVLLLSNIPILKRKSKKAILKNIPIIVNKEKQLIGNILSYITHLKEDQELFSMTRKHAWRIVRKQLGKGYFPHFLRHARITRLVVDNNFNTQDLVQFIGWSDSRPASTYTHLSWQDIANKMER